MKISFYNGVSGMLAYQEDMNRISHNVANSGTVGYKPTLSDFSDLLYTNMAANSLEEPLTGHGVKIGDARLVYRQGAVLQTGMELDFAFMGDGFFAVQKPDGSIQYTRNGAFNVSVEGNKGFLVTADGSHVLDSTGKAIELAALNGQEGLFDLSNLENKLGIYDFPNPYGLVRKDSSCFVPTETSGAAYTVALGGGDGSRIYRLQPGALEQSAVDLADEMVNVIVTQRAFQLSAKMVQTADQLEEIVNTLRQ